MKLLMENWKTYLQEEEKNELENLMKGAFGKVLSALTKLMKSNAKQVSSELEKKTENQRLDEGVVFGLGVALAAPAIAKTFAQIAKMFASTVEGWTGKNTDKVDALADKIIEFADKVHHKFIIPIEFFVKKVLRIKDEKKAEQASQLLFNLLIAFLMVYSGVGAAKAAKAGNNTLAGFEGMLTAVKGGEVSSYIKTTMKQVVS